MAFNQTDWINLDKEEVSSLHEERTLSVPVYGDGIHVFSAGELVVVSSQSDGNTVVQYPSQAGLVTHIIRADADDPYGLLSAYVLEPGQELLIPASALDVTVQPGENLIAGSNGNLQHRAGATDYVVCRVVAEPEDDYVRVITVLSQTP